MNVEIVNTGSELMLGRVLNSHQQWLCRKLANLGLPVRRQVAVSDTAPEIAGAIREALSRADVVISTGGLGPTSDDLTRDAIAALLERKLSEDPETVRRIESFFSTRGRPMPQSTRVQAMIPKGAKILQNDHGTAPGLAIHVSPNPFRKEAAASWLVMLPGPPRELYPMFDQLVAPLLLKECPPPEPFHCKTLKTHGLGESLVEERITGPLEALSSTGLQIGYCARVGEVEVRLTASGPRAARVVEQSERIVRACLNECVYGEDEDQLPGVVVHALSKAGQTVALAESCTGGGISHRLTNIPGASAVLRQGWITYSNESKVSQLGVPPEVLAIHGAVSEPVARAMAEGARQRAGADFALAVTGIAGPSGGTAEKPVGTVFIALASREETRVVGRLNPFDRETFKFVTSQQALDMLRRAVLRLPAS